MSQQQNIVGIAGDIWNMSGSKAAIQEGWDLFTRSDNDELEAALTDVPREQIEVEYA